jgi:mannose-6-phosphate isomerase-like protein (cupin superfamily)
MKGVYNVRYYINQNYNCNNRYKQNNRNKKGNSDYGPQPYVTNIDETTKCNDNYRTVIWTGKYSQTALMCSPCGSDIGLEVHPDTDQFLRVESGCGTAMMGDSKDNLNYQSPVDENTAVFVPAGTWHNIVNNGTCPLKLYSIYAPAHHPHGTIYRTKEQAEEEND